MTQPLEDQLKQAYYYTEAGEWRGPEVDEWDRWHAVAKVAASVAESATVEPVQEPVALMWQHEETGRVTFTTMADPYVGKRWHRIPLYAAAPQQPMHCPKDGGECGAGGYCRPEQRKPLTPSMQAEVECDCLVAWNASTYGHSAQDTVHPMFLSAFLSGYRAAERAHDITGEPT